LVLNKKLKRGLTKFLFHVIINVSKEREVWQMKLYTLVDGEYVEVELGFIAVDVGFYGTTVEIDIDRTDNDSTLTTIKREV
jgi:hypothetical protein